MISKQFNALFLIIGSAIGSAVFLTGCDEKINSQKSEQAKSREIGSISTDFNLLGLNSSVHVKGFDDPDIEGITCYISFPVKGGVKGALGLADQTSDASIACIQTAKITAPKNLSPQKTIFNEQRNLFFKNLNVIRYYDNSRNVVIYQTTTRQLFDGSPKSSLSAVSLGF
jgi:CreA protein